MLYWCRLFYVLSGKSLVIKDRAQGFSSCFARVGILLLFNLFLMKDFLFMTTANSSSSSPAAKAPAAAPAKSTSGGAPVANPTNSASAGGAADFPHSPNHPPRQIDIPVQGERQCYFGEVVNERGTYWAQLLVRVVDKVSVMVDTPDCIVVATHLLGGNAKLFLNRQVTHTEVLRSASGEDQILLHTKGGSGYPDKLVFQYNRV